MVYEWDMANLLAIFVLFQSSLWLSNGYKILVISPVPSKSHARLGEGMVKHLAEAGHEITYITAVLPKKSYARVNIIDVSNILDNFNGNSTSISIKDIMDKHSGNDFMNFVPILMSLTRSTIENENVQKLLKDKSQHFDVAVIEWTLNEVLAGFSAVFNCPFIWFSPIEPHWMITQLIDEVPNPAYNIGVLSSNVPPLTFTQRVGELFVQIMCKLFQKFYVAGQEEEMYENLLVPHIRNRGLPVPSLVSLKYNGSLILSNSHVSLGIPLQLPPNFISVGGFHIDTIIEPLPKDLQKLMHDAKDGVIYFSMGSSLSSKDFPYEIKESLLKFFGKLKQTVIWKFEEDLPNRPKNVHILDWAPQQSILAHKNCALFITHGGLLSTTETIHFGVPVIGIPVWADQFVNVDRGVKKGFALKVDLTYKLVDDLETAVKEILSNKKYTEKVKELSTIYHDRAIHPSKNLVHWVEHVVKTGGARHLRSPAFLMPWYQKLYLDLLLIIIVSIILIKYILSFILRLFKQNKSITGQKKIN